MSDNIPGLIMQCYIWLLASPVFFQLYGLKLRSMVHGIIYGCRQALWYSADSMVFSAEPYVDWWRMAVLVWQLSCCRDAVEPEILTSVAGHAAAAVWWHQGAPRVDAAAVAGVPSAAAGCGTDASVAVTSEVWYHLHIITQQ